MEYLTDSPILYHLALTLFHFVWQGGLIALGLKLCLSFTHHSNAQLRYVLACGAMASCLIAPVITFILIFEPNVSASSIIQLSSVSQLQLETTYITSAQPWHVEVLSATPYLSLIWLSAVALLASKMFIEVYQVNKLGSANVATPSDELLNRFVQLSSDIGLKKTPRLVLSLKANVPMAIGWLRPVVLLPVSMITGLTPSQLDMLILHEFAHIKRHDYLVNFLQTLVETLLFFHPGVHWISKQMRIEREYCSDDMAISVCGEPLAYAHTLADTASLCNKHRHHAIPTMAMAASGGDLKQRVLRLVDQHHCSAKEESSKFIASILIIASVLAIVTKPLLNFPVVDFSSDQLSFLKHANQQVNNQTSIQEQLSETSIANLLRKQEKSGVLVVETESKRDLAAVNSAHDDSFRLLPSVDQEVSGTTYSEEAKMKDAEITVHKSHDQIAPQIEKVLLPEERTQVTFEESLPQNSLSATNIEDKPIDTTAIVLDKKVNTIHPALTNPYSSQLKSLLNEPEQSFINFDNGTSNLSESLTSDLPHVVGLAKKRKPEVVSALAISSPDPRYPSSAKRKGIELDVKVNFVIDTQGRVKNIQFEKKNKVAYFRRAIRNAMQKWHFQPATQSGKPVESTMSKIFSFSLTQ